MKKILILLFIINTYIFACGCTDSAAADSFKEQATSTFESLDSDFSNKIEELKDVLSDIKEIADTTDIAINDSNRNQQVLLDSVTFTLEQRQMINSIIQKQIFNWEIQK